MGTNPGTNIRKITDSYIKSLKAKNKEQWIRLEDGLYLRIRPKTGRKFFVSRYSFNGKQKKLTLGEYPALKLTTARKMNLEIKEKLANGIDPLKEREEQKQQLLEVEKLDIENNLNKHRFSDIAYEWLEHKEQNIADVTYYKLLGRVENYLLPTLGDKFIEDITKKDVIEAIKKFPQIRTKNNTKNTDKSYTYRTVFNSLKEIFKYAVHFDVINKNVCELIDIDKLIPKPQKTHYKAITDERGFKQLYKDIKEVDFLNDYTRNALLFLAQTALRPGNVRNARWENLDLNAQVLYFPASDMKMKRDFRLPLTKNLMDIIAKQEELTGKQSPYIFPSPLNPSRKMSENTLNFALKRMNYTNHNSHGFRSSFSTLCYEKQKEHGFSEAIIESQLAHTIGNKVVQAYMRSDFLEERRELLKWWYEFLEA